MKQIKLDTLLIIRGLLAVSVAVWHIGILNANTPAFINIPGRTAVWMFFGISGYVIAYGFIAKRYLLNKRDIKAFYINRFLRIYPLFLLLSLVSLVTAYYFAGNVLLKATDIPAQLFMLQFNHEYILSGVFWTLGIEVQFYLIAPLLIVFFINNSKYFLLVGMYLLLLLWVPFAFYTLGWGLDGRNLISNLSHFVIGMIGCKMVLEGKYPKLNKYLLIILILSIIFFTNYFYQDAIRFYWTLGSMLIDLAILLAIILHAGLEKKKLTGTNPMLRFFTFLGVISYGVYAWHPYLIKYIPALNNSTLLTVVITIVAAFVSYKLVEQPVLKMKQTRKERIIIQ